MRKRYILFAYNRHTAHGGLSDEVGRFDDISEIKIYLEGIYSTTISVKKTKGIKDSKICLKTIEHCQVKGPDYWDVLDLDTGDKVSSFRVGFETPERYEKIIDIEWL